MSRRYPKEFHEFMREFIPGHSDSEVAAAARARFEIEITPAQVKSYKGNHKLRSGTPGGMPKGTPSKSFPAEVTAFIKGNYVGTGPKAMAERLNAEFGTTYTAAQLKGYYSNHSLNSGLTCRYEKGHVPANKGKKIVPHPNSVATQFKPGRPSLNERPVGALTARSDGYLHRKIGPSPKDWIFEHIRVWQEVHGPVPHGHKIIFLDGDRHNCELNNLRLVSDAEHAVLNRGKMRSPIAEITDANITIAKLRFAIFAARRSRKEALR